MRRTTTTIRRRDFLATLGALPALGPWRRARGQDPVRRGAVVIGINKSGTLPVLNAAASGAKKVADWLRAERFEVKELLDTQRPVAGSDVFRAVDGFLQFGTLEQLVIYFSGHGFLSNFAELWLLSDAPRNPNEAINHRESVELARRTDVPNIVFISDACRSTPNSLGISALTGRLIFPASDNPGTGRVTVDQFFAALPGAPALELPVGESTTAFEGIYTAAFLEAFRKPDRAMVKRIGEQNVVPNRLLKDYLLREVNRRAEEKSIRLTQRPESRVESDETIYLGRVRQPPTPGSGGAPMDPPPPPPTPATIEDVAASSLASAGLTTADVSPRVRESEVTTLAAASGFESLRSARLSAAAPPPGVPTQFETRTGFLVYGASIARVTASVPAMQPEVLDANAVGPRPAIIRLRPMPGTLAIRFTDGSGGVVAALPDYIGTLIVREGAVVDLNYVLSGQFDSPMMREVHELRAAVATAAQYGVFRIEGNADTRSSRAGRLGDRIRMMKGVDPTLGLYACYAYADAGLINKINSVRSIMRGDLGFDVFDVAMLAGALAGKSWSRDARLEPFCPMLAQGWNLLRVNRVGLPDAIQRAGTHLTPSLWTTFAPPGMDIIEEFLRRA